MKNVSSLGRQEVPVQVFSACDCVLNIGHCFATLGHGKSRVGHEPPMTDKFFHGFPRSKVLDVCMFGFHHSNLMENRHDPLNPTIISITDLI